MSERISLVPDLIFTPEEPPIPTLLLAVGLENEAALLGQKTPSNKEIISLIKAYDWEPVLLRSKTEASRAMDHMVLRPSSPDEETVVFSSEAEAIATVKQRFIDTHPISEGEYISIEDMRDYMRECGIDVDELDREYLEKQAEGEKIIISAEFNPMQSSR